MLSVCHLPLSLPLSAHLPLSRSVVALWARQSSLCCALRIYFACATSHLAHPVESSEPSPPVSLEIASNLLHTERHWQMNARHSPAFRPPAHLPVCLPVRMSAMEQRVARACLLTGSQRSAFKSRSSARQQPPTAGTVADAVLPAVRVCRCVCVSAYA